MKKYNILCLLLFIATISISQKPRHHEDVPLTPGIRLSAYVSDRYEKCWKAWNNQTNTYDSKVVNPDRWEIHLTGCASKIANDKIVGYDWVIEGIDDPSYKYHYNTSECSSIIPDPNIKPGKFQVTMTVKTKSGVQKRATKEINASDYLVVSIGDSFSSGEGNPDVEGIYNVTSDLVIACKDQTVWSTVKNAQWVDKRCHRSKKSGPAVAGKLLEDEDRQTSVSYLSFACSGASVEHLTSSRYEGQHPIANETLPPQIDAVKAAVGSRTIDLLIISIGMNDLGFSGFIKDCANPLGYFSNCDPTTLYNRIDKLDEKYKSLALDIRRNLKVKNVMIMQYPVEIFSQPNGAEKTCECLSLGKDWLQAGLNDAEKSTLSSAGTMLNKKIEIAARENDWTYVYGVINEFKGHGYCTSASQRYFRRRVESIKIQGRRDGAMHPNTKGHEIVGTLLYRATAMNASMRPSKKVTIKFDKILSGWAGPTAMNETANVSIDIVQVPKKPFNHYQLDWPILSSQIISKEVKKGEWTQLEKNRYTFEFDVYDGPQPLNTPTDFDIIIVMNGISLSDLNKPSNTSGRHIMLSPDGIKVKRAGIEYSVVIKDYPKFGPADPNQKTTGH